MGVWKSKKRSLIFIILGVVLIVFIIVLNKRKEDKEYQEALDRANASRQESLISKKPTPTPVLSFEEKEQLRLVEKFGPAPDGFRWKSDGNLEPLSDDSMTSEDVVFTFLRALSMLDFSTAEKYSLDSSVIDSYQDYYNSATSSITNYRDNFLRKQFKRVLTSLEVGEVIETAIFADGTQYITMNVTVLDLSDKSFWENDREVIFQTMYSYDNIEGDDTKMMQYLYDYVLDKYSEDTFSKRTYEFDLVITRELENGSGWLITNDKELESLLTNDSGVDIISYIRSEYSDWLQVKKRGDIY